MICRSTASSSARSTVVPDDVIEYAKRLRDEGHDLESIIAMGEGGAGEPSSAGEDVESTGNPCSDVRRGRWGTQHTCLALLVAGFVTRFAYLEWPAEVVFDEVHFGKFIGGYISGKYFFDIHPPFGKLFISACAYFGGYRATQAFESIGEPYGAGVNIFALRAAPATFGALLVPLAYLLSRELGCSDAASLLVAGFVLLDGALLVESRLLLTDSVLFFFELLQLYAMAKTRNATPRCGRAYCGWLLLSGVGIAASVATKWTALATMGVVGLESVRSLLEAVHGCVLEKRSMWRRHLKALEAAPRSHVHLHLPVLLRSLRPVAVEFALRFACLLLLPALFYVGTFVLHFLLLPHTGPGDKFHNIAFRCMLDGPPVAGPSDLRTCTYKGCRPCEKVVLPSLLGAIWQLNKEMLTANAHIKTGHSFGSGYLSWPLNSQPVFYWQQTQNARWCKIYMAGNPVIWRGALVLCGLMVLLLLHHLGSLVMAMPPRYATPQVEATHRRFMLNGWLLVVGYLVAWLPFAFVERVAFLYHYIPPLLLTFLGAGIAFDLLTVRLGARGRAVLCALLLVGCAASSWYFAPLYYGLPMQPDDQAVRVRRLDNWLDRKTGWFK